MLKFTTIIGTLAALLLFSGCGAKPKAYLKHYPNGTIRADVFVHNGAGVPSWSANESEAFENVLETAATVTLDKGYKYFAIITPKEISNIDGSLLNTTEEIFSKCVPNSLLFISIPGTGGLHKCGTQNTNANIDIIMYHEEQTDFTVFNASNVLAYMKEHGSYEAIEVDVIFR